MEDPKICQSCGMPLEKKEMHGTNTDGSMSDEYCTYCFQNGDFTDADSTLEDKIEKNVDMAVNMGMSEDDARSMATNTLPNLERWRI